MSDDFPTLSEVGEQNIREYARRKKPMRTVHDQNSEYCPHCKETGGEIAQAPRQVYCMAIECDAKNLNCLYVRKGGVRP